jgi:hypothetical protein
LTASPKKPLAHRLLKLRGAACDLGHGRPPSIADSAVARAGCVTIEFDTDSERQMRQRTTRHGSASSLHAPWLVSLVMWSNCMRFVDENGLPVGELEGRARTTTNLAGMQRWGYITIGKDPADRRPKAPRSAWVTRPAAGRRLLGSRRRVEKHRTQIVSFSSTSNSAGRHALARHHPRSSRAAGAIGWTAYRAAVPSIPRIGTLPRRLASVGPQARDPSTLSHGAAQRRIPRRQLR